MSTPVIFTSFQPVNSTSYADIAALETTLARINGEPTDVFAARMKVAAVEDHSHTYEGVVNEIALALGLGVRPGLRISGPPDTVVTCDLSGISLVSGNTSVLFPLAVLGEDNVWNWHLLSSAAIAISGTSLWTATLLTTDGPAIQLCRQTNQQVGMPYNCVVSDVGLIGMTEASLPALAETPSGGLAYQVREFLQAIMTVDQSYWAK